MRCRKGYATWSPAWPDRRARIRIVKRVIARTALALLIVSALAACRPQPPDDRSYTEKVTAAREEKEAAFRNQPGAPVPQACMNAFLPLDYFPIDPVYAVPAVLRPTERDEILKVATSTGTIEDARRLGQLEFVLRGQRHTLTAFASQDASRMWVPFRDTTNDTETYKVGRYLDITRSPSGVYQLDFNDAYNPYCYYNAEYICPIPPPENALDVRIEAGEKIKPQAKC